MAKNNTTWANNISKKVTNWTRDSKPNLPYKYDDPTIAYDDARDFFYDLRLQPNELNNANLTVWIQN